MGATMQSKCIEMEADADIPDQNKYTSLFLKIVIILREMLFLILLF